VTVAVSVVISNFNGAKFLPRLISSLKSQRDVETEIICVDRNSSDNSIEILSSHPEIRVISEPPESGLVSGYAVGIEAAQHDLIFCCNEDMWFDPDCLQLLAMNIDLSRGIFAADPWQWSYDGATWIHGVTRFESVRFSFVSPYPFRAYYFTESMDANPITPFGCAGALMMSRRTYEEIGGWDRSFFLDHEDVDLFIRAWHRNLFCVSVPEAKVYHAVNASNNHVISRGRQKVGRRRYVSGKSSIILMSVKYFPWRYVCLQLLILIAVFLNRALLFQSSEARNQLAVIGEVIRRWPAGFRYRRESGIQTGRTKDFFTAAEFQRS
jgi:GT2 family glycosyltransferase